MRAEADDVQTRVYNPSLNNVLQQVNGLFAACSSSLAIKMMRFLCVSAKRDFCVLVDQQPVKKNKKKISDRKKGNDFWIFRGSDRPTHFCIADSKISATLPEHKISFYALRKPRAL